MPIVFSAGNSGPGPTIGSPGTAKNVITVGASENVQAFGGPTSAPSRTPRRIAPRTWRLLQPRSLHRRADEARSRGARHAREGQRVPGGFAAGTARRTCFTGSTSAAGPPRASFSPVGQQWNTASSGTSHSARRWPAAPPSSASTSSTKGSLPQSRHDQRLPHELGPLYHGRERQRHALVRQPGHGHHGPGHGLRRRGAGPAGRATVDRFTAIGPRGASRAHRGRTKAVPRHPRVDRRPRRHLRAADQNDLDLWSPWAGTTSRATCSPGPPPSPAGVADGKTTSKASSDRCELRRVCDHRERHQHQFSIGPFRGGGITRTTPWWPTTETRSFSRFSARDRWRSWRELPSAQRRPGPGRGGHGQPRLAKRGNTGHGRPRGHPPGHGRRAETHWAPDLRGPCGGRSLRVPRVHLLRGSVQWHAAPKCWRPCPCGTALQIWAPPCSI